MGDTKTKEKLIAGLPAHEYHRQWRLAHGASVKASQSKYRAKPENKERARAYREEYNKTPAHKESQRRWYIKNSDQEKSRVAKWRKDNREKNLAYKRAYLQSHLEEHRLRESRRRALKKGVTVGEIDLEILLQQDDCGICKMPLEDKYEIDHIIPISRGGYHMQENLQLAHPLCNNRKSNKLMEEMCESVLSELANLACPLR